MAERVLEEVGKRIEKIVEEKKVWPHLMEKISL